MLTISTLKQTLLIGFVVCVLAAACSVGEGTLAAPETTTTPPEVQFTIEPEARRQWDSLTPDQQRAVLKEMPEWDSLTPDQQAAILVEVNLQRASTTTTVPWWLVAPTTTYMPPLPRKPIQQAPPPTTTTTVPLSDEAARLVASCPAYQLAHSTIYPPGEIGYVRNLVDVKILDGGAVYHKVRKIVGDDGDWLAQFVHYDTSRGYLTVSVGVFGTATDCLTITYLPTRCHFTPMPVHLPVFSCDDHGGEEGWLSLHQQPKYRPADLRAAERQRQQIEDGTFDWGEVGDGLGGGTVDGTYDWDDYDYMEWESVR